MRVPSILFYIILLNFGSSASPFNPLSSTKDNFPTTPSINATILDHNNNDITSFFQVLLYQQEGLTLPTASNLTDRRRQPSFTRLINTCGPLTSLTFISSHCNFKDGTPSSLQSYTLVCQHGASGSWRTPTGRSSISRRQGHCYQDEICVTTTSQTDIGILQGVWVQTASCVLQSAFRTRSHPSGHDVGIQEAWAGLLGLTATTFVSAVVSREDRETPMEVDSLEVESAGSNGVVESEKCRDCVDLGTSMLPVGTDSLKAKARLLMAGTGAVVGVLWLAVLSG